MHIKYITNVRLPTTRAQGYAIMKMCEEFSLAGVNIELYVPNRRSNEETSDPFSYYNIKNKFPIIKLWSIDLLGPFEAFGKLFYWIDMLSFLMSVKLNAKNFDGVFYTRDYLVSMVLPKKGLKCVELHDLPKKRFLFEILIHKFDLFFVLNVNMKNELIKLGIDESKITLTPNGVDLDIFNNEIKKSDARTKIGLPQDKKIVMYTGHLYDWKGVDTLAEASKFLKDFLFVFVGGVEPELSSFIKKYKNDNVLVVPSQNRDVIPLYLKAADILVVPNSKKDTQSNLFTSPIKIFEYMASKRPIIASDLPSIREILNNQNSFFALPDEPNSFVEVINHIISDSDLSDKISEKAFIDVKSYTWGIRAKKILNKINENTF